MQTIKVEGLIVKSVINDVVIELKQLAVNTNGNLILKQLPKVKK